MKEYFERLAATENAKRVAAYKLAVAGWVNMSGQDYSLGLPPRPFPEVPKKQAVIEIDGEFSIVESFECACAPLLTWGPDGQTINTPLPKRQATTPFRREGV